MKMCAVIGAQKLYKLKRYVSKFTEIETRFKKLVENTKLKVKWSWQRHKYFSHQLPTFKDVASIES